MAKQVAAPKRPEFGFDGATIATKASDKQDEIRVEDDTRWPKHYSIAGKDLKGIRLLVIERNVVKAKERNDWGTERNQCRAQLVLSKGEAKRLARILTKFAEAK